MSNDDEDKIGTVEIIDEDPGIVTKPDDSPPDPKPNNTDYVFPTGWDELSKEEKCKWMTQERCRRQAEQQGFRFSTDFSDVGNDYRVK